VPASQGQARTGPPHPDQSRSGQAYPGQSRSGQAYPDRSQPGQAQPGQAYPGQSRQGQSRPDPSYPGQPRTRQEYPQREYPRQEYQGRWPDETGHRAPAGLTAEPADEAGRSGGAEGNERLTALTGAVLLALLAAEGFTILSLRQMLTAHFFIGMLLLGPVALKLGSTVYRFSRYYTGSAPYRRKGPPAPLLRLLGPVVVAATVGIFGSGIMLAVVGPRNPGPWTFLHKGFFVVWFGAMSVHVLAYVWRIPALIAADFRGRGAGQTAPRTAGHGAGHGGTGYGGAGHGGAGYGTASYGRAAQVLGGRGVRLTLLAATLLAGLLIAALTVHLAAPWQHVYING
jgi:hypothetical protein